MLMLKAFIDDSHSGQNGPVFVLAGYVSTVEKWATFADRWQALLDEAPKIKYFKMVEAFNRRDQFIGWSEPARDARVRSMVEIINTYAMEGVISVIPMEPFNRLFHGMFWNNTAILGRPYFLSFYGVMTAVVRYLKAREVDGRVDFIFDKGNEAPDKLLQAYDMFVRQAPDQMRRYIGDIIPMFEDDRDPRFLPLQAADMLAWHARRFHNEIDTEGGPSDPVLRKLYGTEHAIDIWDEARLQKSLEMLMRGRTIRFSPLHPNDRRLHPKDRKGCGPA